MKLTPDRRYTIEKDGFFGCKYEPRQNAFHGKALVMVGGSDGYFSLVCLIAEQFVKRGMTVLALAYWNRPGLPAAYEKIPIEPVRKAALCLQSEGYEKIGLWGFSKGAELVLLAGSVFTDLISCVVAVSPINICGQGIKKGERLKTKGIGLLDCSSWSLGGEAIPYASLRFDKRRILTDSLKEKGVCMRSCYEDAVANAPEEARLKVEAIKGPILFLSAERDGMWPAKKAADRMMERLDQKGFLFPHAHYSFAYASHFLLPYPLKLANIFAVERKYPEKCKESNWKAFEETLAFLRVW